MADQEEKKDGADSGGAEEQQASGGGDEGKVEGAPAWMATFADMVTLLMCFFVLLFAMSSTQQESFKELVESLKSALGVQQVPEAGTREGLIMHKIPDDGQKQEEDTDAVDEAGGMVQKELDQIVSDVRELIMFNQLGGMVKVEGDENGAKITISDVLLFPSGEAQMSRGGLRVMKKIANILSQFQYQIRIEGHTDNSPIHTTRFPSNWELSADRACEVVRFLITQGVNPNLMAAVGHAEFRPVATNDTAEGRAENRRVEVIYERQSIIDAFSEQEESGG